MGSTGRFREDSVAHTVGRLSEILHPRFVINQGDFFHDNGVRDTLDPLWDAQFEKMFTAPGLNVKWYSIIGNHEYIGNSQALIDYGKHHPRWTLPDRNYTFVRQVDSVTSIRFVMIDTSPFAVFYRFDPKYRAVKLQDPAKTVAFADSVLAGSRETWKVVVGHHPVYTSDFSQGNTYRLIEQIAPLLRKYKVDFYLSGHIHKFEHTHRDGVDYLTTSTGVKPRWTNPWFFIKYVKRSLGFTVSHVTSREFSFYFINEKGETLYSYRKKKE
jgi:3',5'-cyclic AMP phosphodiesterase CpdA